MFHIGPEPIDARSLRASIDDPKAGAFLAFEGIVRADTHALGLVNRLYYHADIHACRDEGLRIIDEVKSDHRIRHAVCVQRIGTLKVGETAIWIGVWAEHRDAAYKANRAIIEAVKKRLLIWKKEFLNDGRAVWIQGNEPIKV